MLDILHHNIKSHGDIRINSRAGDIRLNTQQDKKVYINSTNSSICLNENSAIGFGTIPHFGNLGDVMVSDGDLGSHWSSRLSSLEMEVLALKDYINELKLFISTFKDGIYLESSPGTEFDFEYLL
jgi:hypothetical protein